MGFSVHRGINEYSGGYHEYTGGLLMMSLGDIMGTGDVQYNGKGYSIHLEYTGGLFMNTTKGYKYTGRLIPL